MSRPQRGRKKKLILSRVLIAIGCIFLATVVIILFQPFARSAFPPLPQPNGYDVLVQASEGVIRSEASNKEMSPDALASFVAQNSQTLRRLRQGLELPCAVPVAMEENWIRSQSRQLVNLKATAKALDAEALLLSRQGNIAAAVNTSLDLARFGQALSKNGVLISFLVGSACEVMAAHRLTNLLSSMSAADCKRAAQALQEHETQREPIHLIARRELEWSRRTYGVFGYVRLMVQTRSLQPGKEWESLMPDPKKEYVARAREMRLVTIKLAYRAFELERSRKPLSVQELMPEILSELPIDPELKVPLQLP